MEDEFLRKLQAYVHTYLLRYLPGYIVRDASKAP